MHASLPGLGQPQAGSGDFNQFAPELATLCASIASDIALVVDGEGVIRNVACGSAGSPLTASAWIGQQWTETVTMETRGKVQRLLDEAGASGISRHRQVNHPSSSGTDIPFNYAAMRLGSSRNILVAGRDLSADSVIQQRFVEREQALERDYWKRRNLESHYRLLFQVATDSIMVVDAQDFRIVEANAASAGLFDVSLENLIGQNVADGIMQLYRPAVHELMVTASASGQPAEIRVPLARKLGYVALSATPFKSAEGLQLLLRARATTGAPLDDSDPNTCGLSIRVSDPDEDPTAFQMADELACLIDQVGARALPDLLDEATITIREFFVQKAIHQAGGDTAQAAGILGVAEADVFGLPTIRLPKRNADNDS